MMVGKHLAQFVVTLLGVLTALVPSLLDAQPALAATPSQNGAAIVPYTPPTGGAYQDSKPFQVSADPKRPARVVTTGPAASSQRGFVEGVSKEMPLARTANQDVYANPDGTYTARIYSGAVNYQAGPGDWRKIDSSVVADPHGGFRNAAGSFSVHFGADSGAASLLEVQNGQNRVGFVRPDGSGSVRPTISGSTITYGGIAANTDLEYRVGTDRVKELIVLHGPPQGSGPVRFTFPVQLNGLKAVAQPGGSIGFFNGATEVFEIPTGQMSDSKVDPLKGASASVPVSFSIVQTASGTAIVVEADGAWLRDPARQYPVSIDPTVANFGGSGDAYVRNDYPTLNQGHVYNTTLKRYEDNAGYYDSTTGTEYTYMHYDMSGISRQRIISATLNIYWIWSYYVSGYTTYWIHPVTGAWNAGTITWNNRPGITGDTITDSAVRNVWRTVNMTSWVQNWTSGYWNNNGIEIDENGNGTTYWKKIAADDNTDGSRGYIQVNYEGYSVNIGFQNSDTDPPTPGYPSYAGPAPNTAATLPVQVTNHGTDAWPANGVYRLSYHLLDRNGATITWDLGLSSRTYMWKQVNPGDTILLNAVIVPTAPGSYILRWDMAHEGVNWFSAYGAATADFKVFVANAPTLQSPADKSAVVDADRTSLIVNTSWTASTSAASRHLVEFSPSSAFDTGLVVSADQHPAVGGQASWQTPAGALKDGARYYWKVVANDGVADSATSVFSLDMDSYQFGQRSTWPMDSIGVGDGTTAGVNLATGNLALSIPAIDLPTVSQPLSMGVTYNSYAALLGAYVDDRLPFGATLDNAGCPITWDQGRRTFGQASVVVDARAGGMHQGCFWSATETYTLPVNSSIEAYVYLDPAAPPQELMLQFHDAAGGWAHRAYWGANMLSSWGTDGTAAMKNQSPTVPATGQWVRLVVKSSDVGLATSSQATLDGLAFTLVGGRGWFDHEGFAQSGLGAGFDLGNHLQLGNLSVARLRAYDAVGNSIAPGDMTTRVDRAEVRESDGTVWVFRNTAPAGSWPQFTPPPGVTSSLARNADGTWSMSGQDGLTYAFATDGSLANVDLDENQTANQPSFRYQFAAGVAPAALTDIWDPMNRHVALAYSNGRLTSITTWDNRAYTFAYDALQRLTSVTSPGGRRTAVSYRDLDGVGTAGQIAGVLQNVTNPRSYTTSFTYGDGTISTKPLDHVVQVAGPAPTSPTTQYTYNAGSTDVRGPRCVIDATNCPNGYTHRYTYDSRHREIQASDAAGNISTTAYDGADHVLMSVDPAGARVDSTFDGVGRPITTISPVEVSRTGAGFYAEYFDNAELAGLPKATQTDPNVDFSWGSGAPAAGVPNDVFSARWTGYVQVPQAGSWTFYVSSRDGVRLRAGTALVIDNWTAHATADSTGTVSLPAGPARIALEYFSASANPEVHLSWTGPGVSSRTVIPSVSLTAVKFATTRTIYDEGLTGLRAAYYNNISLSGRASILRTDLGTGASGVFDYSSTPGTWPGSPLGTTGYSARWTGRITVPSSGSYFIGAITDDGVRVSVDGNLVVSSWIDQAPTERDSSPLTLTRGPHRLTVEYYQNAGGAQFNLRWQRPGDTGMSDVPTSALSPDYGLVTSSIDANGNITSHSYSGNGIDPVRGLETDTSSTNTDADGVRTTLQTHNEYDSLARVVASTGPKGMATGTPDANYRRTNNYYAAGDTYGRDGLLQSTTVPGRGTTTYDYERISGSFSSGRITQKVDEANGTWAYGFDADGNRTALTPPGRSLPTVTDYDANGNVTRVSDPLGGTVTHIYNELDQATGTNTYDTYYNQTTPPDSSVTPSVAATAQYDGEGNVLSETDPAGTITYHYNVKGQMDTATDQGGRQILYDYEPDGKLRTKTLPNNTIVHFGYDAARRFNLLQNHRQGTPEVALADYQATYDPLNKISAITGPDGNTGYTYDTLGRLEQWTEPNTTLHRYFFDLSTNRTKQTVNGVVSHSYSYTADATDRLTSVDGGAAYVYDALGNTKSRPDQGGQAFSWDAFGKLQSVTTSAGSVNYVRDALGRVRERIQKDGAGIVTADTVYRFDGSADTPAFETTAAGVITKSYLCGPDGLTITYAGVRTGTPTYTYVDIHGNVVLTADASGTVTGGLYTYDPFGAPTNAPAASPYGFVGKWQKITDPLSGLILMGVRPYDPLLGRFLAVDPAPGGSANDYDYVGHDPVNGYDLAGTFCIFCVVKTLIHNPIVRAIAITVAVAAVCAGTAGLGCGLAVGVGLGMALSVADYQINERHHSLGGYVGHAAGGAFDGALSATPVGLGGRGIGFGAYRFSVHLAHKAFPKTFKGGFVRTVKWLWNRHQFRPHVHWEWPGGRGTL